MSRYIYHIIRGREIYVGQADRQEEPYDINGRLMEHFTNTYRNKGYKDASVKLIKKGMLQDVVIHVYDDENFGLSQECYESFFSIWNPGIGKTKSRKKFRTDETEKTFKIQTDKNELTVSGFDKLNAAEIMHSIIMQLRGYTVVGKSMGGQNMATFLNTEDSAVSLNKNTSPQEALHVLSRDWNEIKRKQINETVQQAMGDFWSNNLQTIAQIYTEHAMDKHAWSELRKHIITQLQNLKDTNLSGTITVTFQQENLSKAVNGFLKNLMAALKRSLSGLTYKNDTQFQALVESKLRDMNLGLMFPTGYLIHVDVNLDTANLAAWTKYYIAETNIAHSDSYKSTLKHITSLRMNNIANKTGKGAKNTTELSAALKKGFRDKNIIISRWAIYFWTVIRTTDFWKNFNMQTEVTKRGKIKAIQRDRLPVNSINYY